MSAVTIRPVANFESSSGVRLKGQCLPKTLLGAKQLLNFGPISRNNNCDRLTGENRMIDCARIRVLSVDDQPLLREGVATIINDQPDMLVVAQAADGREAIERFRAHRPDVTLLDLKFRDSSGIETMISIYREFPRARIVMLTMFDGDIGIRRALEAGARGYLLKSTPPEELVKVIRQVHAGKKHVPAAVAARLVEHLSGEDLSERETQVLQHLAGGNRNRDIAERLFIAEQTVKVHVKHIMEKLGAHDRTHALAIAARRGFIEL
jgi:DNA-binding NarL/FixJ family response regulator